MNICKFCALDENNKLFVLKSKNLVSAIAETESLEIASNTLIIFERESCKFTGYSGVFNAWYKSVLVSHGDGWNLTNNKHGVGEICIELTLKPTGEYIITAI